MASRPPPDQDRTIVTGMPGGSADPDRTVIGTGPGPAPATDNEHAGSLPIGARLGEFEIIGYVAEGGFGIVYRAMDHSLGRVVALKEYMPSVLASRTPRGLVTVKSERHAETFEAGRRSFVNEARLLAKFDHPSLVKVYRFWEANGTAYMVMPLIQGPTLKAVLQTVQRNPSEEWLKRLLGRLVDALAVLHQDQCYHRDIAPDNILLVKDDWPVLLDFGAARRVIGDMTQAPTVILKPGYAPYEQYAEMPNLKQGPWTDIYALAAVVYFAITGKPPVPSVSRVLSDPLEPLAKVAAGRYGAAFLEGVDRGLSVKPQDRPQSVSGFAALLGLPAAETARTVLPPPAEQTRIDTQIEGRVPLPRPPKQSSLRLPVIAVASGLAVLAGGWLLMQSMRPPVAPNKAEVPVAPAAPQEQAQAQAKVAPQPETPPPPPPPPPRPVTRELAMAEVVARADPGLAVAVTVPKPVLRIGKDPFEFEVRAEREGYLYLFMVGTDPKDFVLLFPNQRDQANRIVPGRPLALPRGTWKMASEGPEGINRFYAMVAESQRDFRAAALGPMNPIGHFPVDDIGAQLANHTGPQPLHAGTPACAKPGPCSDAYGIATFTIEERP